jgi:dihydroneopterin aldolase
MLELNLVKFNKLIGEKIVMYTHLKIENLAIPVIMGVPEEERKTQQNIILNLELRFKDCAAMYSDKIEDAICYATLSQKISQYSCSKEFKLIEHYGYFIFEYIKKLLPKNVLIKLNVAKSPPLANLERASFVVSDWE